MPFQPVKVVSSMGEQLAGKSFTLNHLVDTSFACSAMRTTGIFSELLSPEIRVLSAYLEGVWMSVSPTDDTLIVALDFEGEYIEPCRGSLDTIRAINDRHTQPRTFGAGGQSPYSL